MVTACPAAVADGGARQPERGTWTARYGTGNGTRTSADGSAGMAAALSGRA